MFEQWLGDVPTADFLKRFYLTQPFSLARAGAAFVPLLSWETIARVLPRGEPRDLLVVRDGRLWTGPDPGSASKAETFFKDGYSLVLRHAERHDPALAELADGFARDFGARVVVQLYATPAGHHSFGWHYDAEEVFILQTVGTKRYFIRENTVRPRPLVEAMPRDMEYEKEVSPLLACPLEPGDWLYVPAGFWHVARAMEDSLSISIGVLPPTAMDVFDELRQHFAESVIWRTRLPAHEAPATLGPQLLQEASRLFGDPQLIERAIAAVQARQVGSSRPGSR